MWEILGKLIVAPGFEKLPKVQYIAQSGHTDSVVQPLFYMHFCTYFTVWYDLPKFRHFGNIY